MNLLAVLPLCIGLQLTNPFEGFNPGAGQADQKAEQKFAALKRQVPGILEQTLKRPEMTVVGSLKAVPTMEVARMTGPSDAKVTVVIYEADGSRRVRAFFSIYLRFYDKHWTTTGFNPSWQAESANLTRFANFVLLAIDKSDAE